ncbi:MAG: CoA transferase [Chloroflexi bacterium]|nr:CoA transferase [Chloroflexota bacterium]
MAPGPLAGIRVFDLTHVMVGPWASMLLGALGADVIKVESPDGDWSRLLPPTQRGLSVVYTHCNLNKRGIVLDLKTPQHRGVAYRIIEQSDVFLENLRPGAVERLGFGYDAVSRVNPRIIYASASAWGRTGPMGNMTGVDSVVQAFSGLVNITGAVGGEGEFFRTTAHLDLTTGTFLVGAVLQGLLLRNATGQGTRVEVTMLGSAMDLQISRLAEFFATGQTPPRLGSACVTTVPHQAFLCQDRQWLAVGVVTEEQWAGLCRALALEELTQDPRFATNADRVQHRDVLVPLLERTFLTRPTLWWAIRLCKEGVPHGPFLDFSGVRHHPQVVENGYVMPLDIPHQGRMLVGGLPWQFSKTPAHLRPAPFPGQHTDEVLKEFATDHQVGVKPTPLLGAIPETGLPPPPEGGGMMPPPSRGGRDPLSGRPLEEQGASLPLSGIRVVDATQGLCGPFTSQLLADAGAQVVKVEPLKGDSSRGWGPPFVDGESAAFLAANRHKQSVALDLDAASGRAVLLRLLSKADVFLEELGPGKAARLGLTYRRLAGHNPKLILCSITPFGPRGPLRDAPGSELVVQAMANYWGSLGAIGDSPERAGADLANVNTAVLAFNAVLAALYHRARTGEGQQINVSMLGTLLHLRGYLWSALSDPDSWDGFLCETYTRPRDHGYHTKDRPVYFNLRRGDELAWVNLLTELGLTHVLADPRFDEGGRDAVGMGRYANELKPIWEEAFRDRTADEVVALVRKYQGEAAPVNDYSSLLADPQVKALGIVQEMQRSRGSKLPILGPPWTIHGVAKQPPAPAPTLGQHTREVLLALGYTEDEVLRLRDNGVISFG